MTAKASGFNKIQHPRFCQAASQKQQSAARPTARRGRRDRLAFSNLKTWGLSPVSLRDSYSEQERGNHP